MTDGIIQQVGWGIKSLPDRFRTFTYREVQTFLELYEQELIEKIKQECNKNEDCCLVCLNMIIGDNKE